jgi:hypothetical protein
MAVAEGEWMVASGAGAGARAVVRRAASCGAALARGATIGVGGSSSDEVLAGSGEGRSEAYMRLP